MATIRSVIGVIRAGNFSYAVKRRARLRQVERGALAPLKGARDGEQEVVVSLTSYGKRLKTVHLAIRSIMMQTVRPHRVCLYLDASISADDLPDGLLALCEYGLEIRAGLEDIGPHKKYFYAFREYPQALVITIDDDALYASDTIEALLEGHRRHSGCVVARCVHEIGFDGQGRPLPYARWAHEWQHAGGRPRKRALAIGCAGVLYPVSLFGAEAFDLNEIRGQAKLADDLYLKVAEVEAGIGVLHVPGKLDMPYLIDGTQDDALYKDNMDGGRNDEVFGFLLAAHGLSAADFED